MRSVKVLGLALLLIACDSIRNVEAKMTLDQITNMLKPMANKCIQQLSLTKATFEEINASGVVPNDDTVGCYYACIFKAMKIMTKDGKLLLESMVKQMEMMLDENIGPRIKAAVLPCFDNALTVTDEPCELTRLGIKCYYEKEPELRFLP